MLHRLVDMYEIQTLLKYEGLNPFLEALCQFQFFEVGAAILLAKYSNPWIVKSRSGSMAEQLPWEWKVVG